MDNRLFAYMKYAEDESQIGGFVAGGLVVVLIFCLFVAALIFIGSLA